MFWIFQHIQLDIEPIFLELYDYKQMDTLLTAPPKKQQQHLVNYSKMQLIFILVAWSCLNRLLMKGRYVTRILLNRGREYKWWDGQ